MPLKIIREDITKVNTDAVVNTANPMPVIGAGTDCAIHTAAGQELLEARKRVGRIAPGHSVATPAFALPARYVLHTVSPEWIDGEHREEHQLRKAYLSALNLARRLGCSSVAFSLLAAGNNGFPRDLALSVAVNTFTDYLLEHEITIYLVLFNKEAFGLATSLFDDLKSYIDNHYVDQRIIEESKPPFQRPIFEDAVYGDMHSCNAPFMGSADDASFTASLPPPATHKESVQLPAPAKKADFSFSSNLTEILAKKESTFSELLLEYLKERKGKDSDVYKRAEISKQLFSKILSNKDYQPTKSTALQLAIGLQLDISKTQKLLGKAGYILTRSNKADLVVQYFIRKKIYSVTFINEALYDCGLPLLKTGLKQ